MPNYNSGDVSLTIDPGALETLAETNIINSINAVITRINGVGTLWQNLALSWNGQSQAEAEDFNRRWIATMTALFGAEGDEDNPGILLEIANVVYGAAANYAGAEDAITKAFTELLASLSATEGGSGSRTDSMLPPIHIDY